MLEFKMLELELLEFVAMMLVIKSTYKAMYTLLKCICYDLQERILAWKGGV